MGDVTFHSLLVTRYKVTRYSLQSSLVTRCKNSLVTHYRSCLLLKTTRYSLQNSLVTRCRSCSLQKITRYSLQKLLVAKNHSLLVAKFACYSLRQITCYSMQKIIHYSLKQSQVHKACERFGFFNIIWFVEPKNSKLFQVNILS